MELSRVQRNALRISLWVSGVLALVLAVQFGTGVGGDHLTAAFQDYLYNGLLIAGAGFCLWRAIAIRAERAAWLVMTAAVASWTAADIVWTVVWADDPNAPYPSLADALWLAFYPLSCVGLALLVRERMQNARGSLWLDGVIGALGIAALASALTYGTVVHEAGAGDLNPQVLTNLAYPIADLILVGVVVAIFGRSGWRPGGAWVLLGVGLALNGLGDGIYLAQTYEGTYTEGTLVDAMWPASALLIGLAAWQKPKLATAAKDNSLRIVIAPVLCGLTAVVLLAYDHFSRLNGFTIALAALTLLLVLVRTALVFAENQRVLAASRQEALTDPLTGLPNRRSLMTDLGHALPAATLDRPVAVVLFDLDGFKEYNDTFGHPAGDDLLVRLGERLADAVLGHGRPYRLGGDEFCVVVSPGPAGLQVLVDACTAALHEHGEGFEVTTSYGAVLAPEEIEGATEALQLADRRMYAHKGDRRLSASRQSRDVLLRTLSERQPDLHLHMRGTADLVIAVGRELDMASDELDDVAQAAELHDVGKIAIPDAILEKPGPLNEAEWAFMRRHTIIGERILMAAPSLRTVAALVRSSHEQWDGSGYPDGLAGEQIPLGSRVVAVCDAFDAMTANRPYRGRVGQPAALSELRRCAGTQFDPAVVAAFERVVEREMAAVRAAPASAPAVSRAAV